jgi:hypothetical protein
VVNVGGGVQAEAAVAVLVVVPGEEDLAVRSCCLDRVEAAGEVRPVLDDWEEWKALLTEAGITKNARLHDARHTCGTLLGQQHVDMHVIQRILGHAQVSTTRIYTDPTDPLTREAVDRIGRVLWPETEPTATRNATSGSGLDEN